MNTQGITDAEIANDAKIQASKIAGLDEIISNLPNGAGADETNKLKVSNTAEETLDDTLAYTFDKIDLCIEAENEARDFWIANGQVYYNTGVYSYSCEYDTDNIFKTKTWFGLEYFYGSGVWHDGNDFYFCDTARGGKQYKIDFVSSSLAEINIQYSEKFNFFANCIWHYKNSTYYSDLSAKVHYIFNKDDLTWKKCDWLMNTDRYFDGTNVWTDGIDTYVDCENGHYVIKDETIVEKKWGINTPEAGDYIFQYKDNVYYADKKNSWILQNGVFEDIGWSAKIDGSKTLQIKNDLYHIEQSYDIIDKYTVLKFMGKDWGKTSNFIFPATNLSPSDVFYDGEEAYYYNSDIVKIKKGNLFKQLFLGLRDMILANRAYIWQHNSNFYYDYNSAHFKYMGKGLWKKHSWNIDISGDDIFCIDNKIYYSTFDNPTSYHYILNDLTNQFEPISWSGYNEFMGHDVWHDINGNTYLAVHTQSGNNWVYLFYKYVGNLTWTNAQIANTLENFTAKNVFNFKGNTYYQERSSTDGHITLCVRFTGNAFVECDSTGIINLDDCHRYWRDKNNYYFVDMYGENGVQGDNYALHKFTQADLNKQFVQAIRALQSK